MPSPVAPQLWYQILNRQTEGTWFPPKTTIDTTANTSQQPMQRDWLAPLSPNCMLKK